MNGSRVLAALGLPPGWRRVRSWLLLLTLLAAANLAVAVALTLPEWREASASGAAVRVNQQAQEVIEPALDRARRVYGRVRDAETEIAELRRRVASRSGSVSEVVSTLRAAVDASGLRAERISYQAQPMPALGLSQLQVTLPVRGSYAQLRTFLDDLLAGPVFAVVERIGASTPGSADPSGQLLLNVVLSAFVDGELANPASVTDESVPSVPTLPPVTAGTDPVALAQTLREQLTDLPEIPLDAGVFDVRLERFDERPAGAAEQRRNLFAFASLPAPPRDEEAARERRERRRAAAPPEPVNPYDLLGVIRTDHGLIATIADDTHVYNVGEDEMLPAGYRVTKVGMVDVWLEVGGRELRLSLRKARDAGRPKAAAGDDSSPQGPARAPKTQKSKKTKKGKQRP